MGNNLIFIDPKELRKGNKAPTMYRKPGMHILLCGASGSGKTSSLLKVTYNLWKEGETIIWRDDANLEFFTFAKIIPIRLFIPEGCDLKFNEKRFPLIEKVFYDWKDINSLFPQFTADKLNVVLFDFYTLSFDITIKFWTNFFYALYRYKRVRIRQKWTLVIDEFNDLAPGSRRGTIQGQMRLSNMIYAAMKKFRKMKIRLVATTHNYNDIHAPLRGQFNYYIFKRLRRDHVPERFWNYAYKIESMSPSQCIIVDQKGNHQFINKWSEYSRYHLDPTKKIRLRPITPYIRWTGEIVEDDNKPSSQRAAAWKDRTVLLLKIIKDLGYDLHYRQIGALLGVGDSYAHKINQLAEEIPQEVWERRLDPDGG